MAVTKVVMPKLSEAMETGKLLRWLKQEGDRISGGDIVAEIETDKADIELEAFGSGVLRKLLVAPGAVVPVGCLIAVIADPGEDIGGLIGGGAPAPPAPAARAADRAGAAPASPASSPAAPPAPAPVAAPAPRPAPEPGAAVAAATIAPASSAMAAPMILPGGRLRASPLARKLAQRAGIDLARVTGTGPSGRIIQRDIEAYVAAHPVAAPAGAPRGAPAAVAASAVARTGPDVEEIALTPIRAAIARQMVQSKAPVPHFYVTTEIAMERAAALREELQTLPGAPRLTVTDLVVRACALTLRKHPGVNASFHGDTLRRHQAVHVGIAVALEDGLITPVLRDCDQKALFQIAAESRDLVERTRGRKLRQQELSGATFSVSNLGMFPIDEFSAIINPPEGAILAVGAILDKPVVVDGQLAVGKRMRVTLSCDHRVMDGAMAARFLGDLKAALEAPLTLLV